MNSQDMPMDQDIQNALNPNPQGLNANDPNVARDPVCGTLVDKRQALNTMAAPVNQPMETLYFCTARCKTLFEDNPEQFGYNL